MAFLPMLAAAGGAAGGMSLGSILSMGGTLAGAIGQVKSAQATAKAAEYNAAVTRMEAKAEEDRLRREASRHMGTMRAGVAKSGVTMEGTPLMVMAESAELAEIDALNARWSGDTSARLSEMRAKSARKSIPYAVGSSLLTGASRIMSRSVT